MRSACLSVALCMVLLACANAQQATKRLPVPEAESVAAAKKLVGEVYRDRYAKAKTAELKLALVASLLEDAQKTSDDPAGRYALCAVALDIAAGAGDWEAALAAIDLQDKTFDVDTISLVDEAREKIEGINKPPRDAKTAFFRVLAAIEQAIAKDRYDVGERLAVSAKKLARRAGDTGSAKQLADRVPDVQKLRQQFDGIKDAIKVLNDSPANPEANLAVGKFRCLVQNRWDEGVPMLALSSDPALAAAAQKELKETGTAAEKLAVADTWWSAAEGAKEHQSMLRRPAVDWYLRVLPQLEGLPKKKAESRVATGEQWLSKDAVYRVSKLDKNALPLASLLDASERFYGTANDQYAFQVDGIEGHIVIDLQREAPISRIYIRNRPVQDRSRGMSIYLSSSPDSRGELVWRAPDDALEWTITLPKLHTARYLTLARDPNRGDDAWFHLRKVKVFGPE
jgi:hypothetical protein